MKPGYDPSASSTAGPVNALRDRLRPRVHDRAPEQAGRALLGLGAGVGDRGAGPGDRARGERGLELRAHPRGLLLDVEPGQHELHRVAEPAELVDAHLEPLGRGLAAHAADRDPVLALLVEADGVEERRDVGAEVARRLDLVDQLRGDRVDRDRPAGAGVLGDHARPVGRDLGDREAERAVPVRQAAEPGEVPAGGLGAALQHVARDHGAGQLVVRRGRPAEAGDRGADHQRGVGDPAGDDDVGAPGQRGGDPEAAEVGVRGQGALEAERGRLPAEVVALDVRDRGVEAEPRRDLAEPRGEPGGVEPAGVADDLDAALEREAEAVLDLADERAGVPQRRVLHRVLAEDQHGQLGEVVAGQHVQGRPVGRTLEHLAHGREPVAVEAGAVPDHQPLASVIELVSSVAR